MTSVREETKLVPVIASDLQCCICMEIYTVPILLRCGHRLCQKCCKLVKRCPLCRTPMDGKGPEDSFMTSCISRYAFAETCNMGMKVTVKSAESPRPGEVNITINVKALHSDRGIEPPPMSVPLDEAEGSQPVKVPWATGLPRNIELKRIAHYTDNGIMEPAYIKSIVLVHSPKLFHMLAERMKRPPAYTMDISTGHLNLIRCGDYIFGKCNSEGVIGIRALPYAITDPEILYRNYVKPIVDNPPPNLHDVTLLTDNTGKHCNLSHSITVIRSSETKASARLGSIYNLSHNFTTIDTLHLRETDAIIEEAAATPKLLHDKMGRLTMTMARALTEGRFTFCRVMIGSLSECDGAMNNIAKCL